METERDMEESCGNRIQRYVFPYIDSNMYILAENKEALVIDPHISAEADRYLRENQVEKVTILLTHEHFDHISGIPWFRKHYDTKVICQQEALNPRTQKHFGRPLVVSLILSDRGEHEKIKELEAEYPSKHPITAVPRGNGSGLAGTFSSHGTFAGTFAGKQPDYAGSKTRIYWRFSYT